MRQLGFTSSNADPDVWFRQSKQATGEEYYEYVLLYVNDMIVISEHAERVLRDEIGEWWELKEESIGPPSKYLGGMLHEVTLSNGMKAWAFGRGSGERVPAKKSIDQKNQLPQKRALRRWPAKNPPADHHFWRHRDKRWG